MGNTPTKIVRRFRLWMPRRTIAAGIICSLTLAFAGLVSAAGAADAAPAASVSTIAVAPATHTAQPGAFGWWVYNYYPNSIWGLTHCNIDGQAMKIGGAVIDYRCWLDNGRNEYVLEVFTQIT